MGAARIVVDPDELERMTADVVRDVPAHQVPGELRRRIAEHAAKREPSAAVRERARKIAEDLLR